MSEPHILRCSDGRWTCRCGAEAATYDALKHDIVCPARPRLGPTPCADYNAKHGAGETATRPMLAVEMCARCFGNDPQCKRCRGTGKDLLVLAGAIGDAILASVAECSE